MVLKTIFRLLVAELCGFCLKIFFLLEFTPEQLQKNLKYINKFSGEGRNSDSKTLRSIVNYASLESTLSFSFLVSGANERGTGDFCYICKSASLYSDNITLVLLKFYLAWMAHYSKKWAWWKKHCEASILIFNPRALRFFFFKNRAIAHSISLFACTVTNHTKCVKI